ncbi:cellulose-binding domain-containing protein [Virgisporangium ochraceum]|uniref:Hydrolase n=1 Tax=Virgisporangium ochraceum TaxID=65505 RepID=A0A8J3ZV87_9ACTN|nr:hydrolase [Virgisporangium ochraceum]
MRRVIAVVAAAVAGGGAAVALAPAADAAPACQVTYQGNPWPGGFTATVRITAGAQAVNGWTLTWTYAGDQRITSGWSAAVSQSGQTVTATNLAWNGSIAPGGSTEFGVQGTWAAANPTPTAFTLNGVACNEPGPGPSSPTQSDPSGPSGPSSPSDSAGPSASSSTGPGGGCGSATLCDGFENQSGGTPSGAWSVVYPNCSGTGTATVDTSVARGGGKSIRVNGGAGYCNHVFVRSTVDLTTIGRVWYGRFYVRHTTALPATHVTFAAMRDAADNGRDLRIGGQNGALQWNRESDDATLPEQSPTGVSLSRPLATGTWTCVEYRVDGSAGQIQTWVGGALVEGLVVDGTPTRDIDSQWLGRANWRPTLTDLRLGWESYGNDADTLWFDDIALGATRIGC